MEFAIAPEPFYFVSTNTKQSQTVMMGLFGRSTEMRDLASTAQRDFEMKMIKIGKDKQHTHRLSDHYRITPTYTVL